MKVLFVCLGNSYRSRLAEAYAKSLGLAGFDFGSAGAQVILDGRPPISPYAALVLKEQGLSQFASRRQRVLTQALLDQADVVVCVNRKVYHQAKRFRLPERTLVWDIADVGELHLHASWQRLAEPEREAAARRTFARIQHHVDELVRWLRYQGATEQVDVLTPDGQAIGRAALGQATSQGLWHRGVHLILRNHHGQVLIQERAHGLFTNPEKWELSLGGLVTAGEQPEQAALRETKEETGLKLDVASLKPLFVWRYNHYLPHYGFHSRVLLHCYLATLPPGRLRPDSREVQAARWISPAWARRLVSHPTGQPELVGYRSLHHRLLDAL